MTPPSWERMLRQDRMPHIFCPGCGIGIVMNCLVRALDKNATDLDKLHVVSGIGCSGRVAGYINADSFHTTHGRALAFATGLSLSMPDSKVVVFSGDGDLTAIGGNHLVHAARRNVDMTVLCVNNYTYGMTGGQVTPTTPVRARASTSPFGSVEHTFNVPHLVDAAGANFVARWTAFHVRQLAKTLSRALNWEGFSFVEVLSPCPTLFLRRNRLGTGRDMLAHFSKASEIRHGASGADVALDDSLPIVVGEFVTRTRPSFRACYHRYMEESLGDDYVPYTGKERL